MAKSISKQSFLLDANGGPLIGELTKVQKQLGLVRDEAGTLRNSQGQVVEGLSNLKVATGQYIDETGTLRNSQNLVIQGLSQAKVSMGMYLDELGRLRNREGELVQTRQQLLKQQKEIEKQERSQEKATEETSKSLKELGDGLTWATNLMITYSAGSGKSSQSMRALAASAGVFASAANTIPKVISYLTTLRTATNSQTVAQTLLNAVTGNWMTLLVGGLAAGGMYAYVSSMESVSEKTETSTGKIDSMSEAVKRLYMEADKLGHANWGIEELSNVIGDMTKSSQENLMDKLMKMSQDIENRKRQLKSVGDSIISIQDLINKQTDKGSSWMNLGLGDTSGNAAAAEANKKTLESLKQQYEEIKKGNGGDLTQDLSQFFNGILDSNRSEVQKINADIELVRKAIELGINPDGKGTEALKILTAKKIESAQKEQDKLIGPLANYRTEIEKLTDQYKWITEIESNGGTLSEQQNNALNKAKEEYRKKLESASLKESMGDEQFELYEKINSYKDPFEVFHKKEGLLSGLLDKQGLSLAGWRNAVEQNKKMLLSSSKYGSFLEKAREELIPMEQKLKTGFDEMSNIAKALGYTEKELENAKKDYETSLKKQDKEKQPGKNNANAAEKGSVEAYKIITANYQAPIVKAINRLADKSVEAANDTTKAVNSLKPDNQQVSVGFWDGGVVRV